MVLVIGDKQNYKQMNIVATVAMPLYNMGKIAELALEGLCNQVTDYKWELIVCEEQNDQMLGWEKILDVMIYEGQPVVIDVNNIVGGGLIHAESGTQVSDDMDETFFDFIRSRCPNLSSFFL